MVKSLSLLHCFHYKRWIYVCWLSLHCIPEHLSLVILRFSALRKMLCIKLQYQWIYLHSFLSQAQLNEGIFWRGWASGLEAMHSTAVEGAQVWEWLCGFSPRSWCNPDISQSEISEPSERLPSALSPGASSILDFWQLSNRFFFPGEAGVEAVASNGERMRGLSTGGSLVWGEGI